MVHFIGAGPGAPDLITLRGARLLAEADVIIYAGSLVNPALLEGRKEGCAVYDSASMTLEEVLSVMEKAEQEGKTTVRLHTGDPSLYGAIREQMDELAKMASHGCTMVLFLSTGLLEDVEKELMKGGYSPDTPAAIVYKATWPDQKVYRCTVSTLAQTAKANHVTKTALITVGGFLGTEYERSKLYDPTFTHGCRKGTEG